MAFTSFNFLIFALITVCVYYATPKGWKWLALLVASYAFYLLSSPKTFVFILLTTIVTFFGGKGIGKINAEHKAYLDANKTNLSKDEKKALKVETQKRKKKIVAVTLIFDFGILAILKYFRVYIETLGFGDTFNLGILIPLGISFYTFQSAAYIMDIYRSKIEPDKNLAKFALFTAFFPQIIQGPISRYDQLAHQLYANHKLSYVNLQRGVQLMMWGFFKKLIVADRIAIPCSQIFDNYHDYHGGIIFMGMLFYTIQIYADFSGGIDIARGVARCMGITMTHNFRRPYFSVSLSEFWNRWHISLSHWCRDYIFYSIAMSKFFGKLGKNLRSVLGDRVGKLFPVIVAQFATFLTIGIWHGAEFKYIAYGLYNGIVIVSGLLLEPYIEKLQDKLHIDVQSKWWKGFSIIRTFFIVLFGRIFPKATSFTAAIDMLVSMFKPMGFGAFYDTLMDLGINGVDYIILIVACVIWFIISLNEELEGKVYGQLARKPRGVRWAVYLLALAAILIFGIYGPGYDAIAFIYRGF